MGSNHRELGRSAESFDGYAECRAAVLRLRERIADAKVLLSTTDLAGGWTWRLVIDGRAAAVTGRSYQRQRDCQYNLGQFLNAVPVAELTEPAPAHRLRDAGSGTRESTGGRPALRPAAASPAKPTPNGTDATPAPGGTPAKRAESGPGAASEPGEGTGRVRDHAGTGVR
ncbi:hypothetical protein [Streptomyces shenzhenensis]|uniref:DUF1508 domain-containing protein n=1 Tax=Streptomyces shenzhenensis TaxID=943815 RepID=A0A3M0I2X5_9ACTN|nr:hypothetical protein [Streptomyces shenzhenensis]RMB82520.1 hypothetical protein CTZ28_29180 [Streptomyces shenzhenensis]